MAKLAHSLLILTAISGAAIAGGGQLPIPEPSILPLLGLGLVAAAVIRRRRK